jgi:hypothetical protein
VWPHHHRKYCSKPCANRAYQIRNREHINAWSREWVRTHPEQRRRNYLRYQQANAKAIYQRNKWRTAHSRARTLSKKALLKIHPRVCEAPGKHSGRIECHHRDGDPLNTGVVNLAWLCKRHHEQVHHAQTGTGTSLR